MNQRTLWSVDPISGIAASGRPPAPNGEPRIIAAMSARLARALLGTFLILFGTTCLAQSRAVRPPAIKSARLLKVTSSAEAAGLVQFTLEIDGVGFGEAGSSPSIRFRTVGEPAKSTVKVEDVNVINDGRIIVAAVAETGVEIQGFTVGLPQGKLESPDGFSVTLSPIEKPSGVKDIVVKHQEVKDSTPNMYSMTITKASGDGEFPSDPALMQIQIFPAEATILAVPYSDPNQVGLRFLAPANFEVKDVYVSVFDSTDPRSRKLISRSKQFEDTGNPDQPTIKSINVVDLQRSLGVGRLIITGSGFGSYPRPDIAAEDYVYAAENETIRDKSLRTDRTKQFTEEETQRHEKNAKTLDDMQKLWLSEIDKRVKVALNPRNAGVPVQAAQILYIDDGMIDVFFKFKTFDDYSLPFRLSHVDVTLIKAVKGTESVQSGPVQATLSYTQDKTFLVSKDAGPTKDPNLEFNYTVMDKKSAALILGRGVADNFYVVEVSVTNKGTQKVAVPLSAIEAEVEWASGYQNKPVDSQKPTKSPTILYLEGPPTLSPVKLAAVTGFFDSYNKKKSHEAMFFNGLEGLVTLATAMFPFVGPSFKDATGVFNSGFIPGAKQVIPDLSGQQLQTISSQSWQDIENIAASGGQVKKFVYIPRGEQSFSTPDTINPHLAKGKQVEIKKRIKNIMGIDVTAYQVTESAPVSATQGSTP